MILAACNNDSDDSSAVIDDNSSDNTPDTLSVANAEATLKNVANIINEDTIEAFYQTANDDQLFQGKWFFISNTSAEIQNIGGETLETPYQVEVTYGEGDFVDAFETGNYSCASGGSLVGHFAGVFQASDWVFDDCVIGSNSYNGTVGFRMITRGVINRSPVYNLSIADSSGQVQSLSGGFSSGNRSFVSVVSESNWNSASYRGPVEGGQLQIDDYTVSRSTNDGNIGRFENPQSLPDGRVIEINQYSVANTVMGSFTVSAPWTQNESLEVTVELSFSDDAQIARYVETEEEVEYSETDPEESNYWQTGSINITAEDGSQLLVTPVEAQRGQFLITTGNGETVGPVAIDVKP